MKIGMTIVLAIAALVFAAPHPNAQNLILNGDFENTFFTGCNFNLTNAEFDAGMPDCTAFSTTFVSGPGEICVMEGSECGWGLFAPSGTVKLGIATGGADFQLQDQFSMALSSPVVAGQPYELSFQAMAVITNFSPDVSNVEIGLSDDPADFGTQIFSGVPGVTWTELTHAFIAPTGGAHLTVRQQAGPDSWNHIDDFALEKADAECFLVIGQGVGTATFFETSHLFETQLGNVEESHAVLMESIPDFVLPGPHLAAFATGMSIAGAVGAGPIVPQTDVPPWMWDGTFTVQVLMWNPEVFPAQPEQTSHGLKVYVAPDGSVSTRPYGTGTGIEVWAETDVNAEGQTVVRFPFSIPGM